MQSPFTIFRKHQKAAMAALTLMAMFAFVFLDQMTRNSGPRQASGGEIAVETNFGKLTQAEVRNLVYRRQRANSFVQAALFEAHPEYRNYPQQFLQQIVGNRMFNLGREDMNKDVVFGHLLRKEARRIGVVVDSTQIDEFIDTLTERKLSSTRFAEIVRELKTSPKELYSMLADELQAKLAIELSAPRDPEAPERLWKFYQQLNVRERVEAAAIPVKDFVSSVPEPSEQVVKDYFEQNKSRFDEIEKGELKPGFKQPRKIKLQYLKVRFEDAEAVVMKKKPVSDKDVEAFYAENKEKLYRFNPIPPIDKQHEPITPEFTPEPDKSERGKAKPESSEKDPADKPEDKKAADEKKPDDSPKTEDGPALKKEEGAKKEEAPGKDEKPASSPTEKEPAKDSQDKTEKPASDKQGRLPSKASVSLAASDVSSPALAALLIEEDQKVADEPKSASDPQPDAAKKEDPKETKPAPKEADADKPEKPATADAPKVAGEGAKSDAPKAVGKDEPAAKDGKPTDGKKPASASAKDKEPSKDKDASKEPGEAPAPPKYKPLDEELRNQIREELVRERALQEMRNRAEKAERAMSDLGLKFNNEIADITKLKPEEAKKLADDSRAALQTVAKQQGMTFEETGLLSGFELSELGGIGKARDPNESDMMRGGATLLLQQFFANDSLLNPFQGQESDDMYVAWKVQDVASHVPQLDDPGVREQVIRVWKLKQAEPLARKRAEDLAALVDKSKKPMSEALAGKTVAEAKESVALSVHETPEFSWLRESAAPSMNPFGPRMPPQISDPIFIEKPGDEFMEVVFEKLSKPDDVAVAPNADKSVFYVVKLKERKPASRDAFLKTPLFGQGGFFQTPYEQLARQEQGELITRYNEKLEKKYALKWHAAVDEQRGEESMEE